MSGLERIDPQVPAPMGRPPEGAPPAPEPRKCPYCGAVAAAVWVPMPPDLLKAYGHHIRRQGEGSAGLVEHGGGWHFPMCTPECERRAEAAEWQRGRTFARVEALRERSMMPSRLSRLSFDTFDPHFGADEATAGQRSSAGSPAYALERALAYASDFHGRAARGEGLFIVGPPGTGKTHLAAALGRYATDQLLVPTLFLTVPELLDAMREGFDSAEARRRDVLKAAKEVPLLILDDLGAENPTEWARERLFVLVNHRYRADLPTVYTSNDGPQALEERLAKRTVSRIIEASEFILLGGPDHRVETKRRSIT